MADDPKTTPEPDASPQSEPAPQPDKDPHTAGILRELTETRAELKRMRDAEAQREAEAQAAADEEARQRGEQDRLLEERDAELARVRAELESYQTAETAAKEQAQAALDAALSERTDADAVRAQCEKWSSGDPRKALEFYREHVAGSPAPPADPKPGPNRAGGSGPDVDEGAVKKMAARLGVSEESVREGMKRSQANLDREVS